MHDVRLRILHAAATTDLTTKQLAQKLADVPQATLYRHVKTLVDHGALEVVAEKAIRGTIELTYRTRSNAARLTREEFAALPADEHRRIYALLLGELKSICDEYLDQPDFDTTRDGMTYLMTKLTLSDDRRRQLRLDLIDLLRSYADDPAPGARSTSVGISIIPEVPA